MIAANPVYNAWIYYKKSSVDPSIVAVRLFLKLFYFVLIQVQGSIPPWWLNCGQRGFCPTGLVMLDQRFDVDIRNSIAVGEAEWFTVEIP